MIIAIGDTHCFSPVWEDICKRMHRVHRNAITVGLGDHGWGIGNTPMPSLGDDDLFIHGNHDNPEVYNKQSGFLGRYGYFESTKTSDFFYLSGAESHDKACRVEGKDWWRNEELSWFAIERKLFPEFSQL